MGTLGVITSPPEDNKCCPRTGPPLSFYRHKILLGSFHEPEEGRVRVSTFVKAGGKRDAVPLLLGGGVGLILKDEDGDWNERQWLVNILGRGGEQRRQSKPNPEACIPNERAIKVALTPSLRTYS